MRIIVSDSSALIDLRKGGLLAALLALPFDLVIPDVLLEAELLSLSKSEKAQIAGRMEVATLEGTLLQEAIALSRTRGALSFYDWAALLSARERPGSVLLTGDSRLRQRAEEISVEVHGVLWAVELMNEHGVAARATLIEALTTWRDDPRVRLPGGDLSRLLSALSRR